MKEIPFLDLVAQHAPLKAEILEAVSRALDTAGFVGGAQVCGFEDEYARFCGSAHAVGMANGTDALRLALLAMGVGPGDCVITVPNTFIATTEAISQVGARFEFVDIERDTALIDPQRLKEWLEKNPGRAKAVVPVHLYGQCADMTAIMALAKRHKLLVLEDAAQAHGATHAGRGAGTFGEAAGWSFYPGKNLGACGEAGAVTTGDAALAEKMRMLRDHGQKAKYRHPLEGYNARLDAIQAAILRIKLKRLAQWNAARRSAAARYDQAFEKMDWVQPARVKPGNVSSHHLYVIHVPDRDALQAHLKAEGVNTGLHYPVPLHLQGAYAHLGLQAGSFPNAEWSAAHLLSLPMYPELGAEGIARVVDAISRFKR